MATRQLTLTLELVVMKTDCSGPMSGISDVTQVLAMYILYNIIFNRYTRGIVWISVFHYIEEDKRQNMFFNSVSFEQS